MLAALALGGLTLTACASKKPADQYLQGAILPDEFRVLSHRPLVVPPEYALRPPVPGKPRPQDLQPETAARAALLGQPYDPNASQGERLLLAKVGADKANANIREVIDDEFGDIAYKSKSFADKVMFWKRGDPAVDAPAGLVGGGATPAAINPAAEEKRIQSLTGGKDITIVRQPPPPAKRKIKLPGL